MHLYSFWTIILVFSVHLSHATDYSSDSFYSSNKAFMFKTEEFAVAQAINICSNADNIKTGYSADINLSVCDDKLCANVILLIYWDLAGNYIRFDTLPGNPLTKFDHKRFTDADYKKLDQILKDKNSMLRILEKNDLIDKSIILKTKTVDAVTGATPATIKRSVVEGAVYSTYTLWHFVNGAVKDSMRSYTGCIYSVQIAGQLLSSYNYETQLFALKRMGKEEYTASLPLIFQVIGRSSPLVKSYIISKAPLPFQDEEQNLKFVSLFPMLDGYSRSIFLDRVTSDSKLATLFLPLMIPVLEDLNKKQLEQYLIAYQKFGIPDIQELEEKISKMKANRTE
jgi:hypothetical protein